MKICSRCKKEKELSQFGNNKGKKDGKQDRCKLCQAEADSKHYYKTREIYMKKVSLHKKKTRDNFNKFKQSLICKKCGDTRWYCLEFHHIDPKNKIDDVSKLLMKCSKQKLEEEIKKCIPLCRNCHCEFHYLEREEKINIQEYIKDN